MRKIILLLGILVGAVAIAQESENEKPKNEFNKWSVDVGAGFNKPFSPFTDGYYSKKHPDLLTAHAGVRYMFNEKFGMRANVMYNEFNPASNSLDFTTEMWSYGLEGVVNLASVLDFQTWTNRVGILGHFGLSITRFEPTKPVKKSVEHIGTFTLGLTPQIRLGNRLALFLDASIHGNGRHHYNFDGGNRTDIKRGFGGYFMTTTAGLNIYLGKHEKHADWYYRGDDIKNDLDKLENRLAELEDEFNNMEPFELPDYLNQDNLDIRYLNNDKESAIQELLRDGYVNVFFKFDKIDFEDWSVQWVHYVYEYMKNNPEDTITIYGYADELGTDNYNQGLSQRRADKIKRVLMSLGIDGNRISTEGKGVDASVDKNDADARKFMRRVNFKLNE